MSNHLRLVGSNESQPLPPKPGVVGAKYLEFQIEPSGVYIRPSSKKGTTDYRAGVHELRLLREELDKNGIPHKILEDRDHGEGNPFEYYVESIILERTGRR